MTKDLETTVAELGDGYRALVGRLESAREVEPFPVSRSVCWRPTVRLVASLIAVLGLAIVFRTLRTAESPSAASSAGAPAQAVKYPSEYVLAEKGDDESVQELIRTQKVDGSWQNDFLTRRNAEALRMCPDAAAQLAFRKAVRNLRLRGIL